MSPTAVAVEHHPLTADLTPEQRIAVTTAASPLCIVAGAGSGKTRVLTRRIAWQVFEAGVVPQQMLTVTFTRRAARELRFRLRALGLSDMVKAGTFHAVALAQLRRYDTDRGRRPRRVLSNRSKLVAELLSGGGGGGGVRGGWNGNSNRSSRGMNEPRDMRNVVADVVNEIGWSRARLVKPESYPDKARAVGRHPPFRDAARFAEVYADYEAAKLKRRMLDLDDVLEACCRLMNTRPDHAVAQRWLHRHLLVDEFQDVNPLQFALLKSWLGDESTLVVVGDPDQAIYGWNGADPELINAIGEHFDRCAVVNLRINFRSTPEILAAAGGVLGKPVQPAFRASGIRPTVTSVSADEEPAVLVRAVRNRQPLGAPWRMQAVLARTNAQLAPLRKALIRNGIPVTVRRENDLTRQPEIVSLMEDWSDNANSGLLACIADTRMALRWSFESGRRDRRDDYEFRWQRDAAQVDNDTAQAMQAKIEAFLSFAEDHLDLNADATVESFATDMGLGDRSFVCRDGVDLLTFHAAKGLEWPIVHLVGLEEGYVPIAGARSREAMAEERRLLHVAVTRALRELHVMWCDSRSVGGRMVDRKPSPWLEAIGASPAEPDDGDVEDAIARARLALQTVAGAGAIRTSAKSMASRQHGKLVGDLALRAVESDDGSGQQAMPF